MWVSDGCIFEGLHVSVSMYVVIYVNGVQKAGEGEQ